jgi:hypothetical protein
MYLTTFNLHHPLQCHNLSQTTPLRLLSSTCHQCRFHSQHRQSVLRRPSQIHNLRRRFGLHPICLSRFLLLRLSCFRLFRLLCLSSWRIQANLARLSRRLDYRPRDCGGLSRGLKRFAMDGSFVLFSRNLEDMVHWRDVHLGYTIGRGSYKAIHFVFIRN